MARKSKGWVARLINMLLTAVVLFIPLVNIVAVLYLVVYKWLMKGKVPYFELF